jgi:site-specific recombinase XerD
LRAVSVTARKRPSRACSSAHLAELGRKHSTLDAYESCLRVHLVPHFGRRPLRRITREQVEAFIALKIHDGLAPKSVLSYLGVLHSIFAFAERHGLVAANPGKLVDKARVVPRTAHPLPDAG